MILKTLNGIYFYNRLHGVDIRSKSKFSVEWCELKLECEVEFVEKKIDFVAISEKE